MPRVVSFPVRIALVLVVIGLAGFAATAGTVAGPHPSVSIGQAPYDANVLEISGSGFTPGGGVTIYLSDDFGHYAKVPTAASEHSRILICEDPMYGHCRWYPFPGGQISAEYTGLCAEGWRPFLYAHAVDNTTGAHSWSVEIKVRCV